MTTLLAPSTDSPGSQRFRQPTEEALQRCYLDKTEHCGALVHGPYTTCPACSAKIGEHMRRHEEEKQTCTQ